MAGTFFNLLRNWENDWTIDWLCKWPFHTKQTGKCKPQQSIKAEQTLRRKTCPYRRRRRQITGGLEEQTFSSEQSLQASTIKYCYRQRLIYWYKSLVLGRAHLGGHRAKKSLIKEKEKILTGLTNATQKSEYATSVISKLLAFMWPLGCHFIHQQWRAHFLPVMSTIAYSSSKGAQFLPTMGPNDRGLFIPTNSGTFTLPMATAQPL